MRKSIPIKSFDIHVNHRELVLIKVALESVHEDFQNLLLDAENEDLKTDDDLVIKMIQRLNKDV